MIELTQEQAKLVEEAKDWYYNSSEQVFQYSGAAGTGKSVVMNAIINALGLKIYEVAPMSFIGSAAIVMRMKGLTNAKTIHSWLYQLVWKTDPSQIDTYLNKPKKIKSFEPKPLPPEIKLICIDEAGCVPFSIKKELESRGVKILACGDLNQLPPVGDNPAYLYTGKMHYLTEIMRQKKDSAIIYLAHEILKGHTLQEGLYGSVWVMDYCNINDSILANSDVIICGKNDTRDIFNRRIREDIKRIRSTLPVYGDKIVCRKNNWQLDAGGINLANGLVGTVVNCPDISTYDQRDKTFLLDFLPDLSNVPFNNVECDYQYLVADNHTRKQIKDSPYYKGEKFEYAYSITTHISQGSQYDKGCYIEEYLNPRINRNLNYTGITRFSRTCFYFTNNRRQFWQMNS